MFEVNRLNESETFKWNYDVFLSFRGDDPRSSFTSDLYFSLQNTGIRVFMDEDSLQRGDSLSPSLVKAIYESRISVIVFSKNYADSRWCLDELVKIMECCRTTGQIVLPVFYDVDPSEVRHQTGEFGKAFQSLLNRILKEEEDRSLKWRGAFREAAAFAGFVVLNSRNEREAINHVVEKVTLLLNKTDFVAENLVGVESRVQDMIQSLNIQQSNDVLLLGIWGMGGIGKTTIAKTIYNKIGRNFEGGSFLANIREMWEQTDGKMSLQEQLLFDILKNTTTKIQSIESGKITLKDMLCDKRVLLVLDDVDSLDQLNALCGSRKWFGSGTRIIITTRDKHILTANGVDQVYMMEAMDDSEAMELFSRHAFKQPRPREDFSEISKEIVDYSRGLPLALEVLGSYLFERGVADWKCVLEKIKIIPNDKVQRKLKISYDGLNDTEKDIFLDIACFFIGMDRNDVTQILNGCGLFADIGISILVERSLVTVDDKNTLGMHDLLRDMGREIIRKNSPKDPEERSRLWFHEDVLNVLLERTGTKAVEGLALKLPITSSKCFSTKAFKKMERLRLLQLDGVQLDGDFKYLSRQLRWLCWKGFPLPFIPSNFCRSYLVSIELENSNMKLVWKETQRMEMLTILNLSHSHCLTQTPDFSYMPNLEKLVLKDCPMLSEVSPSIGHLRKILLINLEDCVSLRSLPRSIYKLKSLKTLILSGCFKIDKLEEDIEQMESLTTLIAENTALTSVPFSILRSKSIIYISLCGHEGLSRDVFPSIIKWMSPTNNLPPLFQTSNIMSSLVPLDVPHSSSHKLSSFSKHLPSLQRFWVECSSELQLSHDAAIILDALHSTNCKEMEPIATTSEVSKHSSKSILIQIGMNCQATSILKEIILQNMHVSGDCLLPGDSYPNWLTFISECSSVTLEVPEVKGRNLKTMICIVYTSTPANITSHGLKNVLVKNCTKATIQVYKSEALFSFKDEEGQRVVSSIEPGNKVEVVFVFENDFIVKKTIVYLVYDEPIGKKMEECQAPEENVIVCSGDENECIGESSQLVEFVKENDDASEPKSDRVLDLVISDSKPDLEPAPDPDPESKLTSEPIRIHDVFLSFRGKDTRSSFTSHLHAALQNTGIKVFKDDDSLQSGDHISTSLSHAIEQSRIAIIVFSKNYGNSRWCLNELEKIMKCERTIGQVVVPVFYHVEPSEVRHQSGEFGTAFGSLLNRISNEVELVESWKKALHTAASIAGFKIPTSRNENEDIKRIVKKVSKLLNNKYLFIADYPVGIKSRVKDMIQPLHFPLNGVKLLGIWGMGGGGKTTIAKAIYNKVGHNFEGRSFLANIGEVWKHDGRQMGLQEQLLFDICKEITKISSIDEGKNTLKKTLCHKRVLILLDDVSTQEQLNALGGNREWLGSGSVIIITTRDLHLLTKRVDNIYKMTLMNESESIELFNWNAFKQASPPTTDFVRLSKRVVEYSGGLPLALEVLGSHLFDKTESEWELVLNKLKIIPNNQVQKKLRISYDGLDDQEQDIFLDIACFFIGMARNDVILILNDYGLSAEIGIRVLVERSLVSVDDKNMLGMHDLMRDMGRGIIREENSKRPEKRSRLWYQSDVIKVLSRQTGTKTVTGLTLKLPKVDTKCFSTKAFEKMKRLRLLQLAEVKLDGDFEYVSRDLKWLSWNGLSHIPTDFYGENLVSIELENSNFDLLWKRTLRMENLKVLNLSHSHCLARSPGFSNMPNLEKLVLTNCPKLCRVSPSIGHLKKVLEINLQDCVSLRRLPRSIYKLKSLETLILSGCKMLDKLKEDIEQMESLTHLLANNTAITTIPFSILRSKTMGYISLCGYEGLSNDVFPSIIWSCTPPPSSFSSFSSLFQTSVAMSFIVSLGIHIPHGSSQQLSSIFNRLSLLRSLWVMFGSKLQLSKDANIILYAFYATLSKDLAPSSATSHVSNMKTSSLIKCCGQLPVSGAKDSVNSLLIQMGMNCQVTNNLKENILQNMNENGSGCLLPGDSHPNWLNFNCEGSSVTFNVPLVEGRMLKTIMIYIVYSSTPDFVAFDGLTNLLVKNYTKATIQLYKRGAIPAIEDEEGQRVVSSIEPGNKVEVAVVFEYRFIVKNITVYLIYGEPIAEKAEECHAQDKNVIVCSGDENEYFVEEASSHSQDKSEPIVCSGEENESFVRKVPHAHNKNEPIVCSGEEKEGFVRKVPHAHNKNEPIVCSAEENEGFVRKVPHAHNKNEPIVCSAEETEGFVRKVSPQVARMDDVLPEIYKFPLMDEEAPNVPLKSEDLIIAASALQPPPANVVSANEHERFKEEIRNELAAQRAKIDAQSAKQEEMDGKLDLLIRLATKDIRDP